MHVTFELLPAGPRECGRVPRPRSRANLPNSRRSENGTPAVPFFAFGVCSSCHLGFCAHQILVANSVAGLR